MYYNILQGYILNIPFIAIKMGQIYMEKRTKKTVDEKGATVRRKQIGLTLTASTKDRLDKICEITGMTKSSAISMCINLYAFEKLGLKTE